jgi:hypothetical protein
MMKQTGAYLVILSLAGISLMIGVLAVVAKDDLHHKEEKHKLAAPKDLVVSALEDWCLENRIHLDLNAASGDYVLSIPLPSDTAVIKLNIICEKASTTALILIIDIVPEGMKEVVYKIKGAIVRELKERIALRQLY